MEAPPISYTYLIIDLCSIALPLAWSFESKISFYKKWKYVLPAIIITGLFFIIWDVIFTDWGVWGFNPKYLSGIFLWNLPLEEWLFFLCIPYACLFTYEAFGYFFKESPFDKKASLISKVLVAILLVLAAFNYEKAYTFSIFFSLAIFLAWHLSLVNSEYMGRFYLTFMVIILPFLIVNGILTGSFIEEEVVWYNNNENLGIRMFTIPVEDTFYGLLLILMNVTIYEYLRSNIASKTG